MNSTVLWGLSSSIAIYKCIEAVRILVRDGVRVIPMLSEHATAFIRPLLLETLTGETVYTRVMQLSKEHHIIHTKLAHEADLLVFAPASAHLLAGLANGFANDLLTTTYLAYEGWTLVAPAMNVHMWKHPATQDNLKALRRRGVVVLEPSTGPQIDGDVGPGRLVEIDIMLQTIRLYLQRRKDLEGQHVLVTAGPTREPIDPVRFISNRSSGKMGFAVAEAALRRGARVTLISGPTHLIPHPHIEYVPIETAEQMLNAVRQHAVHAHWILKCAAVSDFRPVESFDKKQRKNEMSSSLALSPTPDILTFLAENRRPGQKIIGFAAETHDHELHAREKLKEKKIDAIILNPVEHPHLGFESDMNQLTILFQKREPIRSSPLSKTQLAEWLWDQLLSSELSDDIPSENLRNNTTK